MGNERMDFDGIRKSCEEQVHLVEGVARIVGYGSSPKPKALELKKSLFGDTRDALVPFQGTPYYARAMELVAEHRDIRGKIHKMDSSEGVPLSVMGGWNSMGLRFGGNSAKDVKKDKERDKLYNRQSKIEGEFSELEAELLRWGASNLRKEDKSQKSMISTSGKEEKSMKSLAWMNFDLEGGLVSKASGYVRVLDDGKKHPMEGKDFVPHTSETRAKKTAAGKTDTHTKEVHWGGRGSEHKKIGEVKEMRPPSGEKYYHAVSSSGEKISRHKTKAAAERAVVAAHTKAKRTAKSVWQVRGEIDSLEGFFKAVELADKVYPQKESVSKPVKPGSEVEHYVHKWKHGEPLSTTGKPPVSREQAIAIGLSEKRGGGKKGKGGKKAKSKKSKD